jgi:hypothetical protein
MTSSALDNLITRFSEGGDNTMEKVRYDDIDYDVGKYTKPNRAKRTLIHSVGGTILHVLDDVAEDGERYRRIAMPGHIRHYVDQHAP